MYDILIFNKVMPNGFQSKSNAEDDNYQFKEFDGNLSVYGISDEGKLELLIDRSNGTDLNSHVNFTGELEVVSDYRYLFTFDKQHLVEIEFLD